MTSRNTSPQEMFIRLAQQHVPRFRFRGSWEHSFDAWKAAALPQVVNRLGRFPERVDPNPELLLEWHQDGLRKQRWVVDVAPFMSAIVIVNIPEDVREGEKRPTILAWHGHGDNGKDNVMGNDSTPERRATIAQFNYDYGRQMAQQGFVTFGLDWLGKGDMHDGRKPHFLSNIGSRDWCNLYYIHATMLGMTTLSLNVGFGMAVTDVVQEFPFVDRNRLGVMGLSGGGVMSLWSSLCDERFKATEIACYSDLWPLFGYRDLQYCGMQVAPGLFELVDLPDLQGLLAPRPLLVDIGAYDTCFQIDNAMSCFRQVEAIYEAASAKDCLELDLFPGEHAWGANKSTSFFGKYLGTPRGVPPQDAQ